MLAHETSAHILWDEGDQSFIVLLELTAVGLAVLLLVPIDLRNVENLNITLGGWKAGRTLRCSTEICYQNGLDVLVTMELRSRGVKLAVYLLVVLLKGN